MKALYINAHGGLEQLVYGELPVGEPGPDEVLLRVRAAALNYLDLWTIRKVPGLTIRFPHVPGNDMAGVVEKAGALVTHVKPGDEVVVAPGVGCGQCESCAAGDDHLCRYYSVYGYQRHGGLAQYAVVRGTQLRRKPAAMGWPEAASASLVFLTAWHMISARARVVPGETCLVMAAGSGVGIASIQIARLFGAQVIATAGSDEKLARAAALGARDTINYKDKEWPKRVRDLTKGRGVDVVIEHTGEEYFESCVSCLAKGGRLVTCGATSGPRAQFDLRLLFARHLSLLGSYMGSRAEWFRVWDHLEAGRLSPVVDSVYPLAEGRAAFERMQSREAFGKLVLTPE